MADVPCLDHLWDGKKDCLDVDRSGASMKKHQEKLLSRREIQMRVTEFQPKRTLSNSNPNG